MADIADFDTVFKFDRTYHFPRDKLAEISHSQNVLHGRTFFERILAEIGIPAKPRAYPPQNNRELRRLHELIIASATAEDQKQSLLYYILKCVGPPNRGNELAGDFASHCFLSRRSLMFIEGIWQLDHLHYREAVELLSSPSLPKLYSEEILEVLLDIEEDQLALAYYQTVAPPLTNPKLLHRYFRLLCHCSIVDAYAFLQTQSEPSTLFEILIDQALNGPNLTRVRNGVELVDLPLPSFEESRMYDYLLHGQGRNLKHAADAVVMRKIATGKFEEVASDLKEHDVITDFHHNMNWQNVIASINRGIGPRDTSDVIVL